MEKNKETSRVLEWRKNNPEKYKAQKKREIERRKESTKSIELDRVQRLFKGMKKRCRENSICCDIKTYKEIEIPTHCPYLNIELVYDGSRGKNSASIDKIIPELGYTKGNIQIISLLANQMKSNATIDELLTFSQSINELYNNPPIII
jgi:hypothetical protein